MVRLATLVAAVLFLSPLRAAAAHPIHMSFTEARRIDGTRGLQLMVRVYANDFAAAAARSAGVALGRDSVLDPRLGIAYLLRNLEVLGADGRASRLTPCGVRRVSDTMIYCLQVATAASQLKRMRNSILTELFSDQVNVVQTVDGDHRTSRLFVRGDGPKSLP